MIGIVINSVCIANSIDTVQYWTGASMHSFGELSGNNPGGVTFGQTINISTYALLDSLTFMVDDYGPISYPEVCTFEVGIMKWSGKRPTGTVLYKSNAITTGGKYGMETFTVSGIGCTLEPNINYVFSLLPMILTEFAATLQWQW